MGILISKTTFLDYLKCPKDTWYRTHHPEYPEFKIDHGTQVIFDEGYEVEEYSKALFPGYVEPDEQGSWQEQIDESRRLFEAKTPRIYQATFVAEGFNFRCDFLEWNAKTNLYDLYEAKSATSVKEPPEERDYISDLAFQTSVLQRLDLKIGRKFVVHINNEYVRNGAIDAKKLLKKVDCTELVDARIKVIKPAMEAAKKYLLQTKEPEGGCKCNLLGRGHHCDSFARSHSDIPDYSVHDLVDIWRKPELLQEWVEAKIYGLEQIPDPTTLSHRQQRQIRLETTKKPEINHENIAEFCKTLQFPLYFLDYESVHPAVPPFDGYRPYQQMVYLLSLHFISHKGGDVEHTEYMHLDASDPGPLICAYLEKHIDPRGTVLVWNKTFEKTRNRELGEQFPQFKKTIERINAQIMDLADPFKANDFLHPEFYGSWSVKQIQPVLAAHVSYDDLKMYQSDDIDTDSWIEMVHPETTPERRQEIDFALREYCKLDTLSMVEIHKVLEKMLAE